MIRYIIIILIVLLIIFTLNTKAKYDLYSKYYEFSNIPKHIVVLIYKNFSLFLPDFVRSLIADFLWIKADEFMHFGPSTKNNLQIIQGSCAKNLETLSILKLLILLDPTYLPAYEILAHNLMFHLGKIEEGIRILQDAIIVNKENHNTHKLYALIGYAYGYLNYYSDNNSQKQEIAIKYYDKAISLYKKNLEKYNKIEFEDKFYNHKIYTIYKVRLFVNLGKLEEAIESWIKEDLPLNFEEGGILGEYLGKCIKGELKDTTYNDFINKYNFEKILHYEKNEIFNKRLGNNKCNLIFCDEHFKCDTCSSEVLKENRSKRICKSCIDSFTSSNSFLYNHQEKLYRTILLGLFTVYLYCYVLKKN